jgi:hypothetical protein
LGFVWDCDLLMVLLQWQGRAVETNHRLQLQGAAVLFV